MLRWAPLGLLVAAAVLAGGGVAAAAMSETRFASASSVAIDQVRGIVIAESPSILEKLSRLRFKYAGLIGTREFSDPVAERLGLPTGVVSRALYAEANPASLVMVVGARSSDADTARSIAQAAGEYLVEYVAAEQEAAGIPPELRFEFRVVTPAYPAVALDEPMRRAGLVAVGLAVVAGVAALVVRLVVR